MPAAYSERPWKLAASSSDVVAALRDALDLPMAAARILAARGFTNPTEAEQFLQSTRDELHDPFLIADLEDAAKRLAKAVKSGERIVVHGDYDADGISGSALLTGALGKLGATVAPFVPDREKDGYGVSRRLIEHVGERGVGLLITVDTGSSAHEELARAKQLGIDVIVCDHHLFDQRPEGAGWFLNPHREDDISPNKDLCGCAVAFKLLSGLARVLDQPVDLDAELDLVAVALLADQMRLAGENRALVRLGIQRIRENPRPGMIALLESARLLGQSIDEQDILYQIAPRINAAGRIDNPRIVIDVLLAEEVSTARPLAYHLDGVNRRRRELDAQLTLEATQQAEEQLESGDPAALVLASESWHMGVVGIAAARVVERFHRPAILLAVDGAQARGSARSIDGIDLKAALDGCSEHLSRYGGHAAAAGMTLAASQIEAFRASFAAAVAAMPHDAPPPSVEIDAILGLDEIDLDLVHFLQSFGPFGQGHREPVFACRELRTVGQPTVIKEKHLKLELAQDTARRGFIGFGLAGDYAHHVGNWPKADVAFQLRYREGTGFDPWQLTMRALRSAQPLEEVSS